MSEQRAGPPPETATNGSSHEPPRVLLIGATPALQGVLDGLELRIVCAGSAEEALRRLSQDDFALALLDVQVPGSDGLHTARLIRRRPETRDLPLLFLRPPHDADFPVDLAYTLGAVDYLEEPLVPVILRAKVAGFVDLHRHKQHMRRLEQEAVGRRLTEERYRAEAEQERRHAAELSRLNGELRREVAERRRAEEALRAADRHKDEFLAMLAHELRNPLAPLRNAMSVLRLRGEDPAVREQGLAMSERQVEQLTRLLDDLLDLSRIGQGKLVLKPARTDLGEVVARAVESVRPAAEARRHDLRVSGPDAPLVLTADPVRLQQVCVNLLTNACRYTPPGGRLRVSLAAEGGSAVLRVADNGIGLPPEFLSDIFNLYAQADRARQHDQSGLGVGLALVRGLTAAHGGSVEAHSAGPGRGSEFVVRLPLRSALAAPAEPAAPPPGTAAATGLRVLVVEDNADAAASLLFLLRAWGHEAEAAHDGPSALQKAPGFLPGVALVDIGLPGMDGLEVGRRLLQDPALGGLLLVALTGHGMDDHRRLSHASGFAHHLVKPVDPEALRDLLRSAGPAQQGSS